MSLRMFDILFLGLLGLQFGSFANVCIYRWPLQKSVYRPKRSYCPWCATSLHWILNLPLISYLFLKGKCHYCRSCISLRYPITEIVLCLLWLGYSKFIIPFQWDENLFFKISILFLLFTTLTTSLTDLDWKIIPDQPLLILFFLGFLSASHNPIFQNTDFLSPRLSSLFSALIAGTSLAMLSIMGKGIFKKEVLGWGDVKLVASLATMTGIHLMLNILFIAFLLGGVVSIFGILVGKLKKNQYIPFGPFINTSTIVLLWMKLSQFPLNLF